MEKVLSKLHDGRAGINFRGDTTSHKILKEGCYCHPLFKYSKDYARKLLEFLKSAGREREIFFPLQHVIIEIPFQQWGIDVIEENNLKSSQIQKYILIAHIISLDI